MAYATNGRIIAVGLGWLGDSPPLRGVATRGVGWTNQLLAIRTSVFLENYIMYCSCFVKFHSCCYHAQVIGISTCEEVGMCCVGFVFLRDSSTALGETTLMVDRQELLIDCVDF